MSGRPTREGWRATVATCGCPSWACPYVPTGRPAPGPRPVSPTQSPSRNDVDGKNQAWWWDRVRSARPSPGRCRHRHLYGGGLVRIHPISFLLGLGAAIALPAIRRVVRPVAVELTAAGMAVYEEAVRVASEKMEIIEDVVAEARAKREAVLAAAVNGASAPGE